MEPPFKTEAESWFHDAVSIVMSYTSCDVEQGAIDAVNCLIEAGWRHVGD